jgi:hypothetical protein
VIVKFVDLDSHFVSLNFTFSDVRILYYLDTVNVTGVIGSDATGSASILLVIDGDLSYFFVDWH